MNGYLQGILWAVLYTFKAKNTLRSILPLPRIVSYIYIHRAYLFTFTTGYTFVRITFYPKQRKITHRLKEYGNGTYVFAESPIIFHMEC